MRDPAREEKSGAGAREIFGLIGHDKNEIARMVERHLDPALPRSIHDLGCAFGAFPQSIWWGQPWRATFKDVVDGLVYGLIIGAVFAWLWPH